MQTSGILEYSDISDIVEALVNTEGRRYPIPDMDRDDIAQEIRLECFRVLSYYEPARIGPSPYKFLQTCVRNFLYNMRRGIWVPNNPPCSRCPLWDRVKKVCVINEVGCEKIINYRANMAAKADLRRPVNIENEILDNIQDQENDASILNQSILDTLPKHLIPYYEKLISGQKISHRMKTKIREFVIEIINNAEDIS